MNDLRIILRKVYKYQSANKNNEQYIVYNYTKNIIEIVNKVDCSYLLNLDSIYKIDNLGDMINKNTDYSILTSFSLFYKKAIDYIVVNYGIDGRELYDTLKQLNKKLNYFLVFSVDYDDFIDSYKSKLNEVINNKKLRREI